MPVQFDQPSPLGGVQTISCEVGRNHLSGSAMVELRFSLFEKRLHAFMSVVARKAGV